MVEAARRAKDNNENNARPGLAGRIGHWRSPNLSIRVTISSVRIRIIVVDGFAQVRRKMI